MDLPVWESRFDVHMPMQDADDLDRVIRQTPVENNMAAGCLLPITGTNFRTILSLELGTDSQPSDGTRCPTWSNR
jgi:hypothetical protein